MSSNVKVFILGLTVAAVCGVAYYMFFFNTQAYSLYQEAVAAYTEGDIELAYTKIEESLKLDNKNKSANKLRSDIYFYKQNSENFDRAKTEFGIGDISFKIGNYAKAAEHYYNALVRIDNISKSAPQYSEAQRMASEIRGKDAEIARKLAAVAYDSAMKQYKSGELNKAYLTLAKSPQETTEIIILKGEIAYSIGLARYNEIKNQPSSPATYYNDAIYWLDRVPTSSDHYKNSRKLISNLQNVLNNK